MFEITKAPMLTDIPDITENYNTLWYDECPILFTGKNCYGSRILASLADRDFEKRVQRYFYLIIKKRDYISFINKAITYREIFMATSEIYVVDLAFDESTKTIYKLLFSEIPEDYIPLEGSFCPDYEISNSLDYKFKLKGKAAEHFLLAVDSFNDINQNFCGIMRKGLDIIKGLGYNYKIYNKAIVPASYTIDYQIEVSHQTGMDDMFDAKDATSRLLTSYIEYNLKEMPPIIKNLSNKDEINIDQLLLVVRKFYEPFGEFDESNVPKIKENLFENIGRINSLSNQIGENFDTIEIYHGDDSEENLIGYIDLDFKNEHLIDSYKKIEELETQVFTETKFRITIYELNINSGKGWAYFFDKANFENKVRISIDKGDNKLQYTKYSKSLHESSPIDVVGKLTKDKSSYSLVIQFEGT